MVVEVVRVVAAATYLVKEAVQRVEAVMGFWSTKTYGGKGYKSPTTQDTGKKFGRGSGKTRGGCYPMGKPRWA